MGIISEFNTGSAFWLLVGLSILPLAFCLWGIPRGLFGRERGVFEEVGPEDAPVEWEMYDAICHWGEENLYLAGAEEDGYELVSAHKLPEFIDEYDRPGTQFFFKRVKR